MTASRARELPARCQRIGVHAATTRAYRLTIGLRPTEFAERIVSLVLATGIDRLEAEGPGLGRKEKVLGHLSSHPVILFTGYSDRLIQMQVLLSLLPMIIIGPPMPKNAFKNSPLTQQFEEKAKNLLKSEIKRRGIGYRELAEKLTALGASETERNLANKISRGGFTAAFFIECLSVIGCTTLRLEDA